LAILHETLPIGWLSLPLGITFDMDGSRLSRFPHLSWLLFPLTVPSVGEPLSLPVQGLAFGVSVALRGSRSVRRITNGHEVKWHERVGTVSLVPPDREQHVYVMTSENGCELFAALIPRGHLVSIAASEGIQACREGALMLGGEDAVISDCMIQLAMASHGHHSESVVAMDETARRLILRMSQLNGDGMPDWHDDSSLFDTRTLRGITSYVDDHLRFAPSLSDMSSRVGMSPSHFAKKFRKTTGLSMHRFINRQRVRRSMDLLRDQSQSLAGIAIDLGFSSQSHFTRLFSALTGMTPARYRKEFKRTVG
jgi:AraC-like DNA-binding protein